MNIIGRYEHEPFNETRTPRRVSYLTELTKNLNPTFDNCGTLIAAHGVKTFVE
ncbi:hypothetical protein DPMN_135023 [Dreissena polymorpha]|uniref:Uncharacterized protein n=1 Tax=Dreissena polymorpha TaxID=45954 RepID=A0A9D4G049_DREPO|nr:hypothetical protein DPMN_135023 [Dreissena polymorpha]